MENYQLSPTYDSRPRARKFLNKNNNHAGIDQQEFYCKSVNMNRNRLNAVMIEPMVGKEHRQEVWSPRHALNMIKQERNRQNMANAGERRNNQEKKDKMVKKIAKPEILNDLKKVRKEPITESLKVQLVEKVELSIMVNEMMWVQPHLNALSYDVEQSPSRSVVMPYVPLPYSRNAENENQRTIAKHLTKRSTTTTQTLNMWMYKDNIWHFLRYIGYGAFRLFFTIDRTTCPGAIL